MSIDSYSASDQLDVAGKTYEIFRLDAVEGSATLPYSLKVLLENLLRTEDGANITADDIAALGAWDPAAEPEPGDPVHPGPGDHAGLHRRARASSTWPPCARPSPSSAATPTKVNPLSPAEMVIDHSVVADLFGTAERLHAQRRAGVPAQPRALPVPALGPDRLRRLRGRPAGHRHRPPGQHRAPRPGRLPADGRRRPAGLPRHLRRHRLAHHDGQRPRRGRLGRRRHRGRGRHARPAGLDADPAGRRLQAHRQAARGHHRHRPGADHHRDAAPAQGGRQVRRVLRPRRRRGAAGQPRHDRQHEPGVRLDDRDLPDRRQDHRLPAADRPLRASRSPWSRPTPRPRACGTTPTTSRATPSTSSSTWPPSCRASPARSARRTGSSWPTPSRASPRRCTTTSTTSPPATTSRWTSPSRPPTSPAHSEPQRLGGAARVRRDGVRGRTGRPSKPTAGHPRRRHHLRPRPRRGDDRRDHLLHQHLEPERDDRRRAGGQEGRRAGPDPQAVGEDHRWRPAPRWSPTTTTGRA